MHRALFIQELLSNIFDLLRVPEDLIDAEPRKLANATFASLALTCRIFSEPALDCLWYSQTSLRPVLRLFFDSTSDVHGTDRFAGVPTRELVLSQLLTGPTDADLTRFLKYARRIRILHRSCPYPSAYMQRIHPDLFQFLAGYKARSTQPIILFPNLRAIEWPVGGVDNSLVDYASLLIGPKLIDLDIEIAYNTPMANTLAQLRTIAPPLVSFALQTHFCEPEPMSSIIDGILECSPNLSNVQLEFLSLSGLHKEWRLLSALPHLRSLWFCLPGEVGGAEDERNVSLTHSTTNTVPFPSLTEFTLFHQMMGPGLVDFLGSFLPYRLPHLEELCLIFEAPQGGMDAVIPHINRVCNPDTLETLKILVWGHSKDRAGTQADVLPLTIDPLHSFPNLSVVAIQPMVLLDLDNKSIEEMARAWPKLEHLDIGKSDFWVSTPRVTLEGLVPLARYCPHLATLSIVVDARTPVPEDVLREVKNAIWSRSLVVEINVSYSPIGGTRGEIVSVASFLMELFPNLQAVSYGGASSGAVEEKEEVMRRWGEVHSMVRRVELDEGTRKPEDVAPNLDSGNSLLITVTQDDSVRIADFVY